MMTPDKQYIRLKQQRDQEAEYLRTAVERIAMDNELRHSSYQTEWEGMSFYMSVCSRATVKVTRVSDGYILFHPTLEIFHPGPWVQRVMNYAHTLHLLDVAKDMAKLMPIDF